MRSPEKYQAHYQLNEHVVDTASAREAISAGQVARRIGTAGISANCCPMIKPFQIRLPGFELLVNHFHLMLELTEPNLSRARPDSGSTLSVWFNRRRGDLTRLGEWGTGHVRRNARSQVFHRMYSDDERLIQFCGVQSGSTSRKA